MLVTRKMPAGPRIVMGMNGELKRKLTQVLMEELTKDNSWEKTVEVLQNLDYQEDPRRTHAVLLKEYFKLSLRHLETCHDLLLREETLASRLQERQHPMHESLRGFL